jgi:hypothetical protein
MDPRAPHDMLNHLNFNPNTQNPHIRSPQGVYRPKMGPNSLRKSLADLLGQPTHH